MGRQGCWFLCVCVLGVGGVSRISPLPCPIPSPPWLPAPFLLVQALPLAAALGCLVFHTWFLVACGSLHAFVPSYLLVAPRRLRLYVFGCIAYLALLAAACMWEYSMGIPFLPMRMCWGRRVLSATHLRLPLFPRLSLCFSLLCGVAWHVTYLYLCRRRSALGGGVCGSLRAYILLCLQRHVCAYAGGIPFAPRVSGRAGVGMFSLRYTSWSPLLAWLLFALRVMAQHVT